MAALTPEYSDPGPAGRGAIVDTRSFDFPGSLAASADVTLCATFRRLFPSGCQWAF